MPPFPPGPPRRSDAAIVLRILATPITWLAGLLLFCLSTIPAVIVDETIDNRDLANWLPLGAFVVLVLATLLVLRRWIATRDWVPADAPVWLAALAVLPPAGEQLDLGGGAALALTLAGLALAAGFTARLIVFHVLRYRAGS
jgi:hypothetical protein